jgi:hypothetical protein
MVVVLTTDEMMRRGLELWGFDLRRQDNTSGAQNLRRFKSSLFGSKPIVYAQMWEDLQTTPIPEARLDGNECVDSFLMTIYVLKEYPTEEALSGRLFKVGTCVDCRLFRGSGLQMHL